MTLAVPQTFGPLLASGGSIPIVQAGAGDPILIYNGDVNNVLLISNFTSPVLMNSIPVQPLTSVTVSDKKKWYAVPESGSVASVTVAPEGTQMSPSPGQVAEQIATLGLATVAAQNTQIGQLTAVPGNTIGQEIAAQIATGSASGTPGGTPLLHGFDFIQGPNANFNIPANGSVTTGGTFMKPAYVVGLSVTVSSGGATCPFLLVGMTWMDSTNTVELGHEKWYIPAASSGTYYHVGKGPVKGAHLSMKLTNLDPGFAMTATLNLLESTYPISRDDWRGVDYQTASVPGYGAYGVTPTGLAYGQMASGFLAIQNNDTLPAHTTWSFLLPLYSGPVFWQFNANTAITAAVRVPTQFNVASDNGLDGDSPAWFDTSLTDVTVEIAHPRVPLYVTFSNTTASAIPLGWQAIMVENCS